MKGAGRPPSAFALLGWGAFLVTLVAAGIARWFSAGTLVAALAGINVTTFALYGYDTWRARRAGRRVPENLLHLFAMAGGSPAALAAQRVFRHKTRKRSFQVIYWTVVVLQAALIAYVLLVLRSSP